MRRVMQLEGSVAHTGPDTFIIRVHFYLENGEDKNDYSAVQRARRGPPGCRRGALVPLQPRRAIHNGQVCRHIAPTTPLFLPPPPAAKASSEQRCGLWGRFLLTTEIRVKLFLVISSSSLPNAQTLFVTYFFLSCICLYGFSIRWILLKHFTVDSRCIFISMCFPKPTTKHSTS